MKRNLLILVLIQALLISSCKKDEVKYKIDDFIQAGQKNRVGIEYIDLEPDINCKIIDPWVKTDTIINLDLNKDGIDDFTISGTMCHPSMLGADCEDLSIIPLLNNKVCFNPITNWLDTIPCFDTINTESNWSNGKALIYSYSWSMMAGSSINSCWKDVFSNDKYFIGYMIVKDERTFFGWIGMKKNTTTRSFNFSLTDYAILKEYVDM